MATQKFHKGDLVRIADDLGPHMSHFNAGCEAIVLGSFDDQCFGAIELADEDDEPMPPEYEVYIKGVGAVAWYGEDQLTLVKKGQLGLLAKWRTDDRSVFSKGEGA